MKKNFLLLLKLYLLLMIATSNLMAQVQGHKQSKHASSVIQDNIKDNFLKTKESTSTLYHTHYYLLATFGQPPSTTQANQIKKYGIEVLQYISDNTYWAKIPSYISTEAISQVGIVALRKFEPKKKIESNLFDEKNQNALVANIIVAPFIPKEEIDKQLSFLGISSFHYYEGLNTIKASLTFSQILKVANLPYTLWVEKEEVEASTLGNIVREHYRVDPLENIYGLTGKDVNIGVWDGGFAGPHIDFMSRTTQVQPTNLGNVFGSHATHVVGNMAGAGTRDPAMRGVATEASIFVYDITNAPPFERYIPFEMFQAIENHQIVITQNSYGSDPNASGTCGTGVPYTVFNRSIDHLAYFYPYLTHHFAVGNSRTNCASAAPANGGYRSTVLNAAKNALNVGALERDNVSILAWSGIASSWGPSRDGRILPHVVALGRAVDAPHPYSIYEGTNSWTGTSHSCPTVSGVSALLVQRYKQLHTNTNPPSSLVRAVICNGATDLGNPYPDYQFGFGRLNALKSVKILNEGNYLIDNVSNGNTKTYTAKINVPANTQRLKVMLSWTDPAAMPNALPALINNLNLQVQHDASFTSFNPWILNPATPAAVATRGIDNLNNIEQVTIDNPSAGTYTIQVTGANVNFPLGGTQEFALVWSLEPEYIEVSYPAGGEKLKPNTNEVIQWDAEGITGGNYTIEFYNGSAWSTVANVNITNNQLLRYTWTTPAIITDQAKIRISGMTISGGSTSDESDLPFTIMGVPIGLSSVVITGTAQNNQIKLDWQPVAGADFYDIYRIRQFDNFSAEGKWQLVGSVAAPITTFNSTGLVNGGGYFHTLRARTNTGVISERAYATGLIFPSGIGANLDIRPLSILSPNANICQTNNTVSVRLRNSGLSAIPSGTSIPISFQINAEPPITENLVLATDLGVNEDIDYTFTASANLTLIGTNTLSITSNLPADGVKANDKISINLLRNVDNMPLSIIINPSNNFCNSATLTAQNFPVDTYALSNIALATEDMTSATLVNLGDDDFKQFSIGFNFTFFGKTYSEFYINSNGLIGFDGFDHDFVPSVKRLIPNTLTPNNFIAFAWSDLDPSAAGTVKYQVLGTAPNRKLVVEFLNIPYYSSTPPSPNRVNAQIMLYESSNVIEIHSINTQISTFASMIMGLENSGGTKGIAIAGRNDSYWSAVNEGLRFVPSNTSLTWFPNGETTPSISTSLSGNIGFSITQNTCTYSSSINISNTCDVTPLDIVSLLPTDNSTSTPLNTNLSITFNKQIKSGVGNITIVGGASPIVIPIGGGATGTVTFSGNTLTINPTMDLEGNVAYHVLIDAGAVTDFATPANIFAGISNANTWNFNTVNHAPILDNTGVFSLSMIDEDVINPIGNTVSEIIASV
ncbi:MAG: S8 family serine peptidase, partial [Thermoflexibacter sp.]|nr:S8 family serine peptidase [Thermoflexibacter sp.]